MNLNKVFIIGRLTADPQLRNTPSGAAVCTLSLATNRTWKDKSGAQQEEAEFHNIVLWGRQAEVASQYLTKGSVALIEGRLRTRSWTDKQGQPRKTTEVIAERMQLGPRPQGAGGPKQSGGPKSAEKEAPAGEMPTINLEEAEDIKTEDLPF